MSLNEFFDILICRFCYLHYIPASFQDFPDTLLSDISKWLSIFHIFVFSDCFVDSFFLPYGTKYSRMDQVKFVKDRKETFEDITSNPVFHKFYLVHSWIIWLISPFNCLFFLVRHNIFLFFDIWMSLLLWWQSLFFSAHHIIAFLALTVHWTFINCTWNYKVGGVTIVIEWSYIIF